MSFKDKVKSLIGIDEEDFYEEEKFELPNTTVSMMHSVPSNVSPVQPVQPVQSVPHVTPFQPIQHVEQQRTNLRAVEQPKQTYRGQGSNMNVNTMMSKVIIREPKDYSDAANIADCLKENLPVFVNLQRLDRSQGRRVIDFLSGTVFALDGDIKRVGNDLFLCTPKSVETDGTVTETADELNFGEL